MEKHNNNDWAAVRRVIEAEKAHAWASVDPLELHGKIRDRRRHIVSFPRLATVAMLLLAVGAGLFLILRPRQPVITMNQLPFFATASSASRTIILSPREQKQGQRLAAWMALARQYPSRESFPAGWLLKSDPVKIQKDTHKVIRKTMLEQFLRVSNHNQEVES